MKHIKRIAVFIFIIIFMRLLISFVSGIMPESDDFNKGISDATIKYLESALPEGFMDIDEYIIPEENTIAASSVLDGAVNCLVPEDADTVEIHFLDVGQGDCSLIIYGDHSILIDAGDNDHGTAVQNYLQKQGIKTLDYLILTHPHADHIGGADVVITKFDVANIIMPDVAADTATYRDVISAMDYKSYTAIHPAAGDMFSIGDLIFQVVGPDKEYDDLNNASLVIRMEYFNNSFLFMGDCEEESEKDILRSGLDVSAQFIKVGHHGSKTSSSEDFIEAVDPQYALISCGENNDYGHPHAATLNTLRSAGISLFRTDEQGTVVITANGSEISANCVPSDTWQTGN